APAGDMARVWAGTAPARTWGQKGNKFPGAKFLKGKNDDLDKLWAQVAVELKPEKAGQMWQQMNDIIINEYVAVPLVDRLFASGKSKALTGPAPRPFDSETWNIGEWKKG